MSKAIKGIGIIRKLNKALPQYFLITRYKSFVRPHLDCGDIIYDQLDKESLNQKFERIQYNVAPCNYKCYQRNLSEQVIQ